MLEIMNTSSQTIRANGSVDFTTVSVADGAGRMTYDSTKGIMLKASGIYKIDGLFVLSNTTSSPVQVTLSMQANGTDIAGTSYEITVPDNGTSEVVIEKNVNVIPSVYGNVATVSFVTSSGATVTNAIADVYKRS